MRGISEERLTELVSLIPEPTKKFHEFLILSALLNQCTELNPWSPIETAPKNKEILIYDKRFGSIRSMFIYGEWRSGNAALRNVNPTHWMSLPEPPK